PDHLERAERSVALSEKRLLEGPPHLRPLREFGLGQARGHREVIARFGRHPHRNAILGRASTPEEAAYVEKGDFVHNRRPTQRGESFLQRGSLESGSRTVMSDVAQHYASEGLAERILTVLAHQG